MQVDKLKEVWMSEGVKISVAVTEQEIISFQSDNMILLPKDIIQYFMILNGTNEVCDHKLFQFYSLKQMKSIGEELKNWTGVPDYSNIVNTLDSFEKYFVFADYSFNMLCYAINLHSNEDSNNEVLVISGDKYKMIASSFSEFINLYIEDSIELQLNL